MPGLTRLRWTVAALLLAAAPAAAETPAPRFALPIACVIGRDCEIWSYFDHDPGPDYRDYRCGTRGTDGHGGTDISLTGRYTAMRRGVAVVAAAPGKVAGVRDGMADVSVRHVDRPEIAKRECGNGVRIDHGGGWISQYCHLRRGSIQVRRGDDVRTGQALGLVGLSGRTETPHLHFQVSHKGKKLDPFRGVSGSPDCGPGKAALWTDRARAALVYNPLLIYALGFASKPMDRLAARERPHPGPALPATAPALVLWTEVMGAQAGDRVRLRIVDSTGRTIIDRARTAAKRSASWFGFAGRKRPPNGWPRGRYTGIITLMRDGKNGVQTVEKKTIITIK